MGTLLLAALSARAAVPFGNGACPPAESAVPAAAETAGASDEGTGAALEPLLPKPGGGTRFMAVGAARSVLSLLPAASGAASALGADAAATASAFCPFWRDRLLPALTGPAWSEESDTGHVEDQRYSLVG